MKKMILTKNELLAGYQVSLSMLASQYNLVKYGSDTKLIADIERKMAILTEAIKNFNVKK